MQFTRQTKEQEWISENSIASSKLDVSKVMEMSQGLHQDERPGVAPGKSEGSGGRLGGGVGEMSPWGVHSREVIF